MESEMGRELAFSKDVEVRFLALLEEGPDRQSALIPVLYLAVQDFGYLSRDVLLYVATRMDLPLPLVLSTATFYTMLHKQPVGEKHIQVCTNVSCFLHGSDELLAHISSRLNIGVGEVGPDKKYSLEEVQCLASCNSAPVIRINEDYYDHMTPEAFDAILKDGEKT